MEIHSAILKKYPIDIINASNNDMHKYRCTKFGTLKSRDMTEVQNHK